MFPNNSIFNSDISALPVNMQSQTWMGNMTQNPARNTARGHRSRAPRKLTTLSASRWLP